MNALEREANQAAATFMADKIPHLREVVEGMIVSLNMNELVAVAHDYRGLIEQLRPLVKIYWCQWQCEIEIADEHGSVYTDDEMSELLETLMEILEYSDKYVL